MNRLVVLFKFHRWYFKKIQVRRLMKVNSSTALKYVESCDPLCLLLFLLLNENKI